MRSRALALAAAAIVTVATACHHDDDPTKPSGQSAFGIQPTPENAVCMQVDDGLEPEVKELPIIDCAQPHSHEIYQTVVSSESVYPGVDALGEFAQVRCLAEFQDFVGISAFDSVLTYTWLVPSLESWNDKKDRTVLCVLARRDTQPMVGTIRGTQL